MPVSVYRSSTEIFGQSGPAEWYLQGISLIPMCFKTHKLAKIRQYKCTISILAVISSNPRTSSTFLCIPSRIKSYRNPTFPWLSRILINRDLLVTVVLHSLSWLLLFNSSLHFLITLFLMRWRMYFFIQMLISVYTNSNTNKTIRWNAKLVQRFVKWSHKQAIFGTTWLSVRPLNYLFCTRHLFFLATQIVKWLTCNKIRPSLFNVLRQCTRAQGNWKTFH